jgi:hypothetical protein
MQVLLWIPTPTFLKTPTPPNNHKKGVWGMEMEMFSRKFMTLVDCSNEINMKKD